MLWFLCRLTRYVIVTKIIKNGMRYKKVIEKYKINGASVNLQHKCSTSCRDVVTDILLLSHWVTGLHACIIHLHICGQ